MDRRFGWGLGAKLMLVGLPFLLLALAAATFTLWVSWQLDGGAAAVNDAGRLRMQAWRMAASVRAGDADGARRQAQHFQQSLTVLRRGDAERPLLVPWDERSRARFAQMQDSWSGLAARWLNPATDAHGDVFADTAAFVGQVDAFVAAIEAHMSRWTALLHLCQMGMLLLGLIGAMALTLAVYRFALEPLARLQDGFERLQGGHLDARVPQLTHDEFGTLAEGFNHMAAHLQSMYRDLEARVAEKTAQLEDKRERLESLYEVSALVARAGTLEELSHGFVQSIRRIAHADAAALRWSDQTRARYLMLAVDGLPQAIATDEHCIDAGDCHCGSAHADAPLRVIPIHTGQASKLPCARAGFATLVSVPVRLHERTMGEVDLFFHQQLKLSDAERSLLETLASHLAGAMENLRLNSLEKEAAVSQERGLLACELHDSIAQSLAFLKIQVQLMRDALDGSDAPRMRQVLGEIDAGVRECYGDVRELLLHFRTRADDEDIERALRTTLRKFEHQSGVNTSLSMKGHGVPLDAEGRMQVLHIVQEALSNVRKHAHADRVWLDVQCQPGWRFEVRDDGVGFERRRLDETHVGMRIMHERAQRIGASVEVLSTRHRGTSVVLCLPPPRRSAAEPMAADAGTAQPA